MGQKQKRRMSAAEFDAVMLLIPTMSAQRRAAARHFLVDGVTAQVIASTCGWGRSAVSNAVGLVWSARERYLQAKLLEAKVETRLPKGWTILKIAAPRAVVRRVVAEVAAVALLKPVPRGARRRPATKV